MEDTMESVMTIIPPCQPCKKIVFLNASGAEVQAGSADAVTVRTEGMELLRNGTFLVQLYHPEPPAPDDDAPLPDIEQEANVLSLDAERIAPSLDPPSAGEQKTFSAVVQRLKGQGLSADDIHEVLLERSHCKHLQYHPGRRTELDAAYAGEAPKSTAEAAGYVTSDKGQIFPGHPYNIRLALGRLKVQLRHNDLADIIEINGLPGYPAWGELTDPGAIRLRFWIEETQSFLPNEKLLEQIIIDVAHAARYHPVKDYLHSLTWDGSPRIDAWPIIYGGAKDTPFNRAVGRLWMIAAVRRIFHPGAKFDQIPVLEGPQGKNKSSALEVLAVNEAWFTDDLPLGEKSKIVIEQTSGAWIVEFPDLTGMSRRELNQVKSFAARRSDRARLAYGRRAQTIKRQWLGCATSNDTEYLGDNENRRWWPMTIIRFDLDALRRDRDQLWAEAVHYESLGSSIILPENLWSAAAEVQAERQIPNPFYDKLLERFPAIDGWVSAEGVWKILEIPVDRRHSHTLKVGQAMKKLGFQQDRVTAKRDEHGLRGTRFWFRGDGKASLNPGLDPMTAEYVDPEDLADECRKKAEAGRPKIALWKPKE